MGGISAGLLSGVAHDLTGASKIFAHGFIGGITSEAAGGDFGSGFLAGAFTQGASQLGVFNNLGDPSTWSGRAANAIGAAVVGGTASVIGGGKFANGAVTGAFSRLFNDLNDGGLLGKAKRWLSNSPDENSQIQELFFSEGSPISIEAALKSGNVKAVVNQNGDVYGKFSYSSGPWSLSGTVGREGKVYDVSVSYGGKLRLSNIELGVTVNLQNVAPYVADQFTKAVVTNSGLSGQAARALISRPEKLRTLEVQ